MNWQQFSRGVSRGLPVGLGYLSVSFGFGVMAVAKGLHPWIAALISATNLTSAGQFAGLTLIAAAAGVWEIVLTQLVINSRYALMSLALSQKMGQRVGVIPRFFIAFFNTDEIFALAMAEKQPLTVPFLLGLGVLPMLGWVGGTALGALAGSILPAALATALGMMLYGMFIAIVVPAAKQEKPVLVVVVIAAVLSCLLTFLPWLKNLSSGVAVVICTVAAAAIGAWLFPIPDEEESA